jgi:hypothetical protein
LRATSRRAAPALRGPRDLLRARNRPGATRRRAARRLRRRPPFDIASHIYSHQPLEHNRIHGPGVDLDELGTRGRAARENGALRFCTSEPMPGRGRPESPVPNRAGCRRSGSDLCGLPVLFVTTDLVLSSYVRRSTKGERRGSERRTYLYVSSDKPAVRLAVNPDKLRVVAPLPESDEDGRS